MIVIVWFAVRDSRNMAFGFNILKIVESYEHFNHWLHLHFSGTSGTICLNDFRPKLYTVLTLLFPNNSHALLPYTLYLIRQYIKAQYANIAFYVKALAFGIFISIFINNCNFVLNYFAHNSITFK